MVKVFESGELERTTAIKEFLNTAQCNARGIPKEKILNYNLDAIIAVGYRVSSARATSFHIWAVGILKEYIKKVFMRRMVRIRGGGGTSIRRPVEVLPGFLYK
ncbi:MAG: virulence RhuM family protein [Bacteroidales bacterium]|nr:virulence RhuM family protein [Bacteroidales bacterium]